MRLHRRKHRCFLLNELTPCPIQEHHRHQDELQCSLLGLLMNLIGDLMYMVVDPRIDFERRGA